MRPLTHIPFKISVLLTVFGITTIFGQTQSKTYTENFNVDKDVVVEVNTSHTNLELDTWNKNQVSVEAVIEVEGISEEEAEKLFAGWNFNAVGNSGKITVSTGESIHWRTRDNDFVFMEAPHSEQFEYRIEIPDVDVIIDGLPEDFVMPPVPPMPPMVQQFGNFDFDYEAYKKDGDVYLKKWKEEFEKNFDEDFKRDMEAWGKQVEELYKEREEQMKEMEEVRKAYEKDREAHRKEYEKMREEHMKMREEMKVQMAEARQQAAKASKVAREAMKKYRIETGPGTAPRVLYLEKGGAHKDLKIKKTIRIKAPKGARLKLNTRYGEVKLAENYRDIDATLTYSRLHAPRVDGAETRIKASYTPVYVDLWNQGELQANYVKTLELDRVRDIKLSSKSSEVVMREITGKAFINGSFGDLRIEEISNDFEFVDIVLENSEAVLFLPKAAFDFYARSNRSRIGKTEGMEVITNNMNNGQQIKGFFKQKGSGKSIHIIADFSNVQLKSL